MTKTEKKPTKKKTKKGGGGWREKTGGKEKPPKTSPPPPPKPSKVYIDPSKLKLVEEKRRGSVVISRTYVDLESGDFYYYDPVGGAWFRKKGEGGDPIFDVSVEPAPPTPKKEKVGLIPVSESVTTLEKKIEALEKTLSEVKKEKTEAASEETKKLEKRLSELENEKESFEEEKESFEEEKESFERERRELAGEKARLEREKRTLERETKEPSYEESLPRERKEKKFIPRVRPQTTEGRFTESFARPAYPFSSPRPRAGVAPPSPRETRLDVKTSYDDGNVVIDTVEFKKQFVPKAITEDKGVSFNFKEIEKQTSKTTKQARKIREKMKQLGEKKYPASAASSLAESVKGYGESAETKVEIDFGVIYDPDYLAELKERTSTAEEDFKEVSERVGNAETKLIGMGMAKNAFFDAIINFGKREKLAKLANLSGGEKKDLPVNVLSALSEDLGRPVSVEGPPAVGVSLATYPTYVMDWPDSDRPPSIYRWTSGMAVSPRLFFQALDDDDAKNFAEVVKLRGDEWNFRMKAKLLSE